MYVLLADLSGIWNLEGPSLDKFATIMLKFLFILIPRAFAICNHHLMEVKQKQWSTRMILKLVCTTWKHLELEENVTECNFGTYGYWKCQTQKLLTRSACVFKVACGLFCNSFDNRSRRCFTDFGGIISKNQRLY